MSLNKTGIDWTDYSWNPISGCNGPDNKGPCWYCYAKNNTKRFKDSRPFGFEPTFYADRIFDKMPKNPSKIFVGSMGDLFGDWPWHAHHKDSGAMGEYSREFVVNRILDVCKDNPQHTYIFLTKNPDGMLDFSFPDNCWTGVTVTNNDDLWRIDALQNIESFLTFVSFEPLLENLRFRDPDYLQESADWVIVGLMSGKKVIHPSREAVEWIISDCDNRSIPLFLKDSVYKKFPDIPVRREFPR